MSNVTPEQQATLQRIWKELHAAGKTSEALDLAQQELSLIFKDQVTDYYRELVMMVVTLAKSLVKNAKNATELQTFSKVALQESLLSFSVSADANITRQKGNEWDTLYGDISAQKEIVRHLLDLTLLLEVLAQDPELRGIITGLLSILHNPELSEPKQDRALLIAKIQTASRDQAMAAYQTFLEEFGPLTPSNQLQESIVVSTMFLSRMLELGYLAGIEWPIKVILEILKAEPSLIGYAFREIPKNISLKWRSFQVRQRVRNLMEGKTVDPELTALIEQFKTLQFIGMGHDQAADLRTGEKP